jgi:hypothetical protein
MGTPVRGAPSSASLPASGAFLFFFPPKSFISNFEPEGRIIVRTYRHSANNFIIRT